MPEQCKQPGCKFPKGRALGYCNAHYTRLRRGKSLERPIRDVGASDEDRFWGKVNKSGECWMWTGASINGYGVFRIDSRDQVAHRVSYMWSYGEIPPGAEVDHMCFNHSCVNPAHLRLLSHRDNGQNRVSANSNSKSGVRGVYWAQGRWIARAVLDRVPHEIGRFDDLDEAAEAASEWRRAHMPASLMDRKRQGVIAMDIADTIVPNSLQINAEDMLAASRMVTITQVEKGSAEQPVFLHVAEFPGRTYRPGKSMRRVLIAAWGSEASSYIGRRLELSNDPSIRFGKDVTGGIRISRMSHIDKPLSIALTVTRGRRAVFTVQPLPDAPQSPATDKVQAAVTAIGNALTLEKLAEIEQYAERIGIAGNAGFVAAIQGKRDELGGLL